MTSEVDQVFKSFARNHPVNKVLYLLSGSDEGQPAETPIARMVFTAIVVAIGVPFAALVIGVLFGVIP